MDTSENAYWTRSGYSSIQTQPKNFQTKSQNHFYQKSVSLTQESNHPTTNVEPIENHQIIHTSIQILLNFVPIFLSCPFTKNFIKNTVFSTYVYNLYP